MMTTGTLTPSSAAAHAPACRPLELLEARRRRDELKTLLRTEQSAMADFLVALADFDARRGWEPLGHANFFAFLHVELKLSKGAAYVRLSAARLIQSHPEALAPLRDGRLCLSSVGELGRVATPANFDQVLPRFFGCSSREAREVAAAIAPRQAPPQRVQITRVAQPTWPAPPQERSLPATSPVVELRLAPAPAAVAEALTLAAPVDSESVRAHEPTGPAPSRAAPLRDDVEPLTADLRRLHITVSRQLPKKLEAAQTGLGHATPGASLEQVIDAAVDLLLEKQAKSRGQVKRPRAVVPTLSETATPAPTPNSDGTVSEPPAHRREGRRKAIPAAVKRAVWARDGGRCSWPLDGGGCCGSTHRLELDHIVPWADWGGETEANLRLTCAAHNRLAARQQFGERVMGRYRGVREVVAIYRTAAREAAAGGGGSG
jgi:hypothetical protein